MVYFSTIITNKNERKKINSVLRESPVIDYSKISYSYMYFRNERDDNIINVMTIFHNE